MIALTTRLALMAPNIALPFTSRWSLRWWAIVTALVVPVVVLRIAELQLRRRA